MTEDQRYQISFVNSGNHGQFPRFKADHLTREAAMAEIERVKRRWQRDPTNPGGVFPLLYGPDIPRDGVRI